ncbi:unnamed protein product [Camellia sinensis]
MSGKAEAEGNEPINEQAVANIYGAMRSDINQIYSKITELEMEASEHSLAMNAIKPLDPSRRCYRMIGGVLVERTIKEVLPAVQRNKEGLEEVIARLNEALEKKKKEVADFEAKYKIRIRKSDEVQDDAGRKEGSAQGVLVGPAVIMSGKAEAEGNEPINEQAVANIYGAMRSDINQIYSKITELEMEASEHSLVMNAIKPLDPSRRCYRMIGGVLVERTIKEVLPAVQRNKEGLEEVIARLNEALEKKKKEVADFEAKYKIRIRKSDEVQDDAGRKEGSAQGVLVGPAGGNE